MAVSDKLGNLLMLLPEPGELQDPLQRDTVTRAARIRAELLATTNWWNHEAATSFLRGLLQVHTSGCRLAANLVALLSQCIAGCTAREWC